jgi:hypothetical protein
LPNCFEDSRMQFPYSHYLSILEFAQTFKKSGRQLLAAFQESFVEIREMGQPIGRKQLELKRVQCMHSLSSKEFLKFKAFGVKVAKKL